MGKPEFTAYQASARGGVVRVRVEGDRVLLGGQAVTVLRAEMAGGGTDDRFVSSGKRPSPNVA